MYYMHRHMHTVLYINLICTCSITSWCWFEYELSTVSTLYTGHALSFANLFLLRCMLIVISMSMCIHIYPTWDRVTCLFIHSQQQKVPLKTKAFIVSIVTMTMATQVFENQFRMDLTGNLLAQCTYTNTLVAVFFIWWTNVQNLVRRCAS